MPRSRFEQVCGPLSLFGLQARHDPVLTILKLTAIWPEIIGSVENVLKVESHVGVARREWNRDFGEPQRKSDRIDEVFVGSIEAMDRNHVFVRAGPGSDKVFGNSQRMRTAAEEVNLHQVSFAAESLSLLFQKLLRTQAGSVEARLS
jgi:hypothetical protein